MRAACSHRIIVTIFVYASIPRENYDKILRIRGNSADEREVRCTAGERARGGGQTSREEASELAASAHSHYEAFLMFENCRLFKI